MIKTMAFDAGTTQILQEWREDYNNYFWIADAGTISNSPENHQKFVTEVRLNIYISDTGESTADRDRLPYSHGDDP